MNFTLGLVQGLAILLPGIMVFAALYGPRDTNGLASNPPPPSSLLAISIIGVGALFAHLIGALLTLLMAGACKLIDICIGVGFETDLYGQVSNIGKMGAAGFAYSMLWLVLISTIAYALTRFLHKVSRFKLFANTLRYGSLRSLVEFTRDDDEFIIADVVVKPFAKAGETINGYTGVVENYIHDKAGVKSIHLSNAVPFVLDYSTKTKRNRKMLGRSEGIPYLIIPGEEIANVALYEIEIEHDQDS